MITFQSTPPSGERSDISKLIIGSTLTTVSIHAPLRREERLSSRGAVVVIDGVSIHAPLRREERQHQAQGTRRGNGFQSTPPSGERSDLLLIRTLCSPN